MKKKVIILSSTVGHGHISVEKALTAYLQEDYELKIVYPLLEILHPIDIIRKITCNYSNYEKLFNFLTRKHLLFVYNTFYYIGRRCKKSFTETICTLFKVFLEKEKPDLIISIFPIANNEVLEVAQSLNIPFLLIPTDLDPTAFILDIDNPQYEKFHIAMAFNIPDIIHILESAHIDEKYFSTIGFPLRPTFLHSYDKKSIKKEFNIVENKPVILFMLGGEGSQYTYSLFKNLKKITHNCHIIVCLGRSALKIKKNIENIKFPDHISTTILGFTENIAQLMAISDFFITKSGSVSVCEALYMNLPLLLDATRTVLAWEQFNHRFVLEYGLGNLLHKKDDIAKKVDFFLKNPSILAEFRNNMKHFEKKSFEDNIHIIIEYLLGEKYNEELAEIMHEYL